MLIGKICKFTEVYGESHSCLNYRWESGVCSFAFLIAYATDTNTFHYFVLFNQSAMPNPRAVRFSPPHCGGPLPHQPPHEQSHSNFLLRSTPSHAAVSPSDFYCFQFAITYTARASLHILCKGYYKIPREM